MLTDTLVCRVCLSSSGLFPHVVCKLYYAYRTAFFVCPCVLCIAGVLLRISSRGQAAKALKRLFFFLLYNMCWSGTLSIPYQSLQTCFFSPFQVSSYLTLQNSVCVCLCGGKLSSYVCVMLRNSFPGALIGCATKLRGLFADVVLMLSVNVWPVFLSTESELCKSVWRWVKEGHWGKNLVLERCIIHYCRSKKVLDTNTLCQWKEITFSVISITYT